MASPLRWAPRRCPACRCSRDARGCCAQCSQPPCTSQPAISLHPACGPSRQRRCTTTLLPHWRASKPLPLFVHTSFVLRFFPRPRCPQLYHHPCSRPAPPVWSYFLCPACIHPFPGYCSALLAARLERGGGASVSNSATAQLKNVCHSPAPPERPPSVLYTAGPYPFSVQPCSTHPSPPQPSPLPSSRALP